MSMISRIGFGILMTTALTVVSAGNASAQTPPDPNPGALTFSGAYDIPTVYMFRGIRQEIDPGFTSWPYADLKIDFTTGDGPVKSSSVNFGVWNSLHTGSSGTGGSSEKLHYEEDFYAALNLAFAKSMTFTTQFTAYTSPNASFSTVKEILLKVSSGSKYAPYGLIAFELDTAPGKGQADGGQNGGTYMELGVGPSYPLGARATLTVPFKLGFSLSDYYESPNDGNDNNFGFVDIGGLVTVPISKVSSNYGNWNVHFGIDYFHLGETTHSFNKDVDDDTSPSKFVALVGIGLSY